jgi:hypothetical protein
VVFDRFGESPAGENFFRKLQPASVKKRTIGFWVFALPVLPLASPSYALLKVIHYKQTIIAGIAQFATSD